MVEKRVPTIDSESITKRAVVSKRLPIEFYDEKRNNKKTTEKNLTDEQKELYEHHQEKLREKNKRKFNNKLKK